MDGRRPFVPKMVAVEEDVVSGIEIAAVRAGGVVVGSRSEVSGVSALEGMSRNELERGGLVRAGFGGEDAADEVEDG